MNPQCDNGGTAPRRYHLEFGTFAWDFGNRTIIWAVILIGIFVASKFLEAHENSWFIMWSSSGELALLAAGVLVAPNGTSSKAGEIANQSVDALIRIIRAIQVRERSISMSPNQIEELGNLSAEQWAPYFAKAVRNESAFLGEISGGCVAEIERLSKISPRALQEYVQSQKNIAKILQTLEQNMEGND